MAHTSDDGAAEAWFQKGVMEGRRQSAYEAGLASGRTAPHPTASAAVRAPHAATMAALAQASVPAGLQGTTSLTAVTGSTPAPVPVAAAGGETIDWDAIATEQNAKTETEAARTGRRVSYGRSL